MMLIHRRGVVYGLMLATLMLCSACSSTNSLLGGNSKDQALTSADWAFAAGAITLKIKAAPLLNLDQGEAHSLVLAVVQMKDSDAFFKLIANPASLASLIASGQGGDLIQVSRYVVMPGQEATLKLDRAQNTHFVGLVAGYFNPTVSNSCRLIKIPLKVSSQGLVVQTYQAAPDHLGLKIDLGETAILNVTPFTLTMAPAQVPAQAKDNLNIKLDASGAQALPSLMTLPKIVN